MILSEANTNESRQQVLFEKGYVKEHMVEFRAGKLSLFSKDSKTNPLQGFISIRKNLFTPVRVVLAKTNRFSCLMLSRDFSGRWMGTRHKGTKQRDKAQCHLCSCLESLGSTSI